MLKLAIIGTGSISQQFITAAHLSLAYKLTAVYSRRLETAKEFAKNYENIALYDDLSDFFVADFDVVYIASPNSIHFQQAKLALQAKKHVIVEKPAFSNPQELAEIIDLAEQNQVFFFEAARNFHEQALEEVKDFLTDKKIVGADFSYIKYSSKMADLLAGQEPNVFSSRFSGGALADLGVYTLYAAVKLFGKPEAVNYTATKLDNSIDLNGNGNLIYPDFRVSIRTGKNYNTSDPAEIYTSDGTLTLNHIQAIGSAFFKKIDGSQESLPLNLPKHQMLEEASRFAKIIRNKDQAGYQECLEAAKAVSQILYDMRQSAGIVFEVDKK